MNFIELPNGELVNLERVDWIKKYEVSRENYYMIIFYAAEADNGCEFSSIEERDTYWNYLKELLLAQNPLDAIRKEMKGYE